MKIVFKRVILDRFLSYGYAPLNLENRGFTLVEGVNQNPVDCARSNGAGKSTAWDAIVWALTGNTVRNIKDVANNKCDGGCSVQLSFSVDDTEYEITRYRNDKKHGSNLKILVNGEDRSGKGIRDSEKLLTEYLPDITTELLGSVVILGQGMPQRFTNNTPSGRKEVLENLSKSNFMIADVRDRLLKRKEILQTKQRSLEDKLLVTNSSLKYCEDDLVRLTSKLTELKTTDVEKELSDTHSQLGEFKKTHTELEEDIRLQEQKLEELQQSFNTCSTERYEKIAEYKALNEQDNQELSSCISTLKSNISLLTNEIRQLEAIKDVCPTCGQKLPGVVRPDTTAKKEQLQQYNAELTESESKLRDKIAEQNRALVSIQHDYDCKIAGLKKELYDGGVEIASMRKQERDLQNAINEANAKEARLLAIKQNALQQIKQYEADIIEAKEKADKINQEILYINKDRDDIQKHVDVITKMTTFATRDFRGYLLADVITFMDQKAKEYCEDVFNTRKLDFTLNGNNIDIVYDDKIYEGLSGGEKQKVDIIVQFALRDMLCRFNGFSCNILALDELFDNLDDVGCENVLNFISKRLVDVESVFIITHHSAIDLPIDSTITIIKNMEGISSIK